MIAPLRKRHKLIWFILPLVLVPLVILSVLQRPVFPVRQDAETAALTPGNAPSGKAELPTLKEVDQENIKIIIRGTAGKAETIDIVLKTPLKTPFAEVFLKGETESALGQIGQRGFYRFETKGPFSELIIRDQIKQVELHRIKI